MRNAIITTTAMAVPQKVLPNSYFNDLLGEDVDTWLRENLTIRERRWLAEEESTADLCEEAAREILEKSGLAAEQLDLIIIATDTPEYISPSTASVLQHRLAAKNAGTFDMNTACAGFVTALDTGSKYIRADKKYNNVLVIGAYGMSKYLNMQDKKTVTLFADGAAGVLLQSSEDAGRGMLGSQLHTEGQYHGWMGIYAGGTHEPVDQKAVDNGDHKLKFVKKFPKEINPTTWARMVRRVADEAAVEINAIDHIFFTQININSIYETMDALGLPMERTHTVMDRYAYTGSACIPMALAEADAQGKIKKGDVVFFMGSGGGLAFACAAFRW